MNNKADDVKSFQNEQSEKKGDVVYKYSSDWIAKLEAESHWCLYWKQQDILQPIMSEKDTVLEIGVGTGFTANYLKSKGHEVDTFDIDKEKCPDFVGNMVHDPFPGVYDHIIAFEVFEHIPYDEFLQVLKKVLESSRVSLCFSVPIARKTCLGFSFKIPRVREKSWSFSWKKKRIWDYHFWEIDFEGLTKNKLIVDIEKAGFKVRSYEEYRYRAFVTCVHQ